MGWMDIMNNSMHFVTVSAKYNFTKTVKKLIIFSVAYQNNGPRLDPQAIRQNELYSLWRENRDCVGRSVPITDIIRRIPQIP